MIARTWSGRVPRGHAEAFHAHLLRTGVADYRVARGCRAAWVGRRHEADESWTRFVLVSLWDAAADAERFARERSGANAAVLYDGDDAFELEPDRDVTHYDVLAGGFGDAVGADSTTERTADASNRRLA